MIYVTLNSEVNLGNTCSTAKYLFGVKIFFASKLPLFKSEHILKQWQKDKLLQN